MGVIDGDGGALLREADGDRLADALRGAGDERVFSDETEANGVE
jgi:hypothetical protein